MASVASLPGSSALKSSTGLSSIKERRSASVNGLSLTSSRQEKVARAGLQDVLDRLGDLRERPRGAVEFEFAALDADKPGLERAGQSAQARGIARHDFDQRRGRGELAGELGDLGLGQEQQPVLFEEFAGAERLQPTGNAWYRRSVSASARPRGAGQFRRRRIHHGQDGAVAIEGIVELVVALAPVQF